MSANLLVMLRREMTVTAAIVQDAIVLLAMAKGHSLRISILGRVISRRVLSSAALLPVVHCQQIKTFTTP